MGCCTKIEAVGFGKTEKEAFKMRSLLKKLGLLDEQSGAGIGSWMDCGGDLISSISPIEGQVIAKDKR